MTKTEYFKDWLQVIPEYELNKCYAYLKNIKDNICPEYTKLCRAFHVCPYNKLHTIIIGLDPYNNNRATGIAFANPKNIKEEDLSPSLQVLKESVIDYTRNHGRIEFDNTLESVASQGVLFLNSALSCLKGQTSSHLTLWYPFISKLIRNINNSNPGLVYVLLGSQAKSFKALINENNHVFIENHPSYYARIHQRFPSKLWIDVNNILYKMNGIKIKWFDEYKY